MIAGANREYGPDMGEWTEAHQRLYDSALSDRELQDWARANSNPQPDPVARLRQTNPVKHRNLREQAEQVVDTQEQVKERLADERQRYADELAQAKVYAQELGTMQAGWRSR